MKFKGKIYIPTGKWNFQETQKWYWVGILLFLTFCGFAIWNENSFNNEVLGIIFKICCFITLGIFMAARLGAIGSSETIKGKLEGKIIITPELIQVDTQEYPVNRIQKLKLIIQDYSDKYEHPGPNYVGPWYVAGVKNRIDFEFDSLKISKYFRIDTEHEFNILKEIKIKLKSTVAKNNLNPML